VPHKEKFEHDGEFTDLEVIMNAKLNPMPEDRSRQVVWRIDDTTWAAITATEPMRDWNFGGLDESRVRNYIENRFDDMSPISEEKHIVHELRENMGGGIPPDVIDAIAKHSATTDDGFTRSLGSRFVWSEGDITITKAPQNLDDS
jgi:hypothetical protein